MLLIEEFCFLYSLVLVDKNTGREAVSHNLQKVLHGDSNLIVLFFFNSINFGKIKPELHNQT